MRRRLKRAAASSGGLVDVASVARRRSQAPRMLPGLAKLAICAAVGRVQGAPAQVRCAAWKVDRATPRMCSESVCLLCMTRAPCPFQGRDPWFASAGALWRLHMSGPMKRFSERAHEMGLCGSGFHKDPVDGVVHLRARCFSVSTRSISRSPPPCH